MTLDKRMKKIQASLKYAGLTFLSCRMYALRIGYYQEKAEERKILDQCLEERSHFVRVINEAIRIANLGDEQIAELKTKNEGWEASFKLYDDAMRRGRKMWQKATGKFWLQPDTAEMNVWLIEQLEQAEADRDKLLGLFGDYEFSPTVKQCGEIWNRVIKRYHQLEKRLTEKDTILDLIDVATKDIEIKLENVERNANLLIEENVKLRQENQLLQDIRTAQANMIKETFAERRSRSLKE